MRNLLNRWLPVIIWAGIIFTLSSLPTLPKPTIIWWDFIIKKTAHVIEYAVLYFLLLRALTNSSFKKIKTKDLVISFIISFIYALSDEYHQTFVPGRTGVIRDVGFDTLGMLLSAYAIKKYFRK